MTCLKREKKNKKLFMVFVDPTLSSLCLLAWGDYQKKGKKQSKEPRRVWGAGAGYDLAPYGRECGWFTGNEGVSD